MSEQKTINNKLNNKSHDDYPLSVNDHKCIGPCYFGDTKTIHPLTLDYINEKYNFCPTQPYALFDPINKTNTIK